MGKQPLGRLEKVALRTYWEHEATQFTPWLAQQHNITLLGDTIGMELEVKQQEAPVGPFRADILCRNTYDDSLVLIENQLERTNHTHLGQLFTYAAGLDTVTVVWIAQQFTEEHRAALDWLNRITHEGFNFFGIEVELWRIGQSPLAPRFNIVVKPNEWVKAWQAKRDSVDSDRTLIYRTLWSELLDHLATHHPALPLPNPSGQNRILIDLLDIRCTVSYAPSQHLLKFYILFRGDHPKAWYEYLANDAEALEQELGLSLEWIDEEDDAWGYALYQRHDFDHENAAVRSETFAQLGTWLERLSDALVPRHAAFRALMSDPEAPGTADA